MDIVIAYDISDTAGGGARRLRDIAAVCSSYGTRVQFSVFECRISPTSFARLLGELSDAMDHRVDSVVIYRFNGSLGGSRLRLGRSGKREVDEPWII